jgi:ABC-type lipoprotein export system ATPase subunit
MNVLQIDKMKRSTVFCEDFEDLTFNNQINFGKKSIVAIYAPNGVGKTSISKVLGNEIESEFAGTFNKITDLRGDNGIFHVIMDQNSRNIIEGNTEDFIMADDIRKERALKSAIDSEFGKLRIDLIAKLKKDFGISKKSSKLLNYLSIKTIEVYTSDLVNAKSKGKNIILDEFIASITDLKKIDQDVDCDKINFIIEDTDASNSIIALLNGVLDGVLCSNEHIDQIEENTDAIKLLNKYINKSSCIVCDHKINPKDILEHKILNKDSILNTLDPQTKDLINAVINKPSYSDPFSVKNTLLEAITTGNIEKLKTLVHEINRYTIIYSNKVCNLYISMFYETTIAKKWKEYQQLLVQQLEINGEDMQFIEQFLNDSLDKKITLKRDENSKEIKLLLDEKDFLGQDRSNLYLSTGEQNFVSLMFELVKAKSLQNEIIIVDDPISSFDSIFKNKIAYALIKVLGNKKQLILTHNTDLLRLLEVQHQGCYNLYIFNNVSGEENGFISVGIDEKKKIIYTNEILEYLRSDCSIDICDVKLFLYSLIPFMRGYAQFIGNKEMKNKLTKLMHGYEKESIDISAVYSALFGTKLKFEASYQVSVADILTIDLDELNILDKTRFPLLNRVFKHTLTYLYLRLSVEKTLVEKYDVDIHKFEMLGDIIRNALDGNENQSRRVFFMSKKTLLNEFNHFEGNMNIFQPAIDISETSLQREKESILQELEFIRAEPPIM